MNCATNALARLLGRTEDEVIHAIGRNDSRGFHTQELIDAAYVLEGKLLVQIEIYPVREIHGREMQVYTLAKARARMRTYMRTRGIIIGYFAGRGRLHACVWDGSRAIDWTGEALQMNMIDIRMFLMEVRLP